MFTSLVRPTLGARELFQWRACLHQSSLTAGTVMDSTKLTLRTWLPAHFLLAQAKAGLSALALMRLLGTSYCTAWLTHHKFMHAMARIDAQEQLGGLVQLDDDYFGGERPDVGGRCSSNQVPIVTAVRSTTRVIRCA